MAEPNIVAEFSTISGTDEELAKYYLTENGNDLERALNMFFANQSCQDDVIILEDEDSPERRVQSEPVAAEGSDEDVICLDDTMETEAASSSSAGPPVSDTRSAVDRHLKIISWNIEGLEKEMLKERTVAVINTLKRESPDVVFLQEVIPLSLNIAAGAFCDSYHVFPGGKFAYFTAILLKKETFHLETVLVEPFPNSQMLRNLIIAKAKCQGISLQLMTSHIESMANQSEERKSQLRSIFARMTGAGTDTVSIFGGDTNAKDREIFDLERERSDIEDVWETVGSPPESRFTWDMSQNDNLNMNGGNQGYVTIESTSIRRRRVYHR
ncbi:TRAF and TNF receptor-associated protein [Apostichopus japonicus]|uniref:TRAF and TNF receptor-associated protein n=1 Tax=Stichopus japonicus TaxID=307972 RepID=A0A2G8JLF6_STIJA|nr:TRAF and TNF receptor-associated protein [Apostichopus japonicus]